MASRILWAVVGGFLVGVFARSLGHSPTGEAFIPFGWAFVWFTLLLAVAALLLSFFDRAKIKSLLVIAAALAAFAAGIMRMESAALSGDPHLAEYLGSSVVLVGIVADEPDVREANVRIHVEATSLISKNGSQDAIKAGVLAIAPAHTEIAYGDTVRVEGKLGLPESFDTTFGRQFNYPMFLAKDGIVYTLSFAKVETSGENHGNILKAAAIRVKQEFLRGLQAVLPEPEAGLAGGITVGDKRSIGKELTATFQTVSLIHVVVLSGYNITLVINAVRRTLLFVPRPFQYGGIGLSVIFVVLMTGGAASAVRAGAMALIAVFARATGRVYLAGRILGVVAFGMVLWNPFTLAFDPGFQLSVLATLGLIIFTPIFAERLQWLTERFGLREIAASTLGTQLMVLPLLLYQNGLMSFVALPANMLALIAVPYAMLTSIIVGIFGMILGSFAIPLGAPALALLAYIIAVAQSFAALPFAAVSVSAFSAWWLVPVYATLLLLVLIITRRNEVD